MIRLERPFCDPGVGKDYFLFPFIKPNSVGQGTWTRTVSGFLGNLLNNTATHSNGDNCTFNVSLVKGTYSIQVIGNQYTDKGILDIDIDGVTISTFDWYGANVAGTVKEDSGIVVAASGVKALRLKIDGKNGSSSGYYMSVSGIVFQKTA